MKGFENLEGKTAVVTGGASGIGRGIAQCFIEQGMNVVIADIQEEPLQNTAREIGATGILTDVTNLSSVENLARQAREQFGTVHVVCNNAGVGPFGYIRDLTIADWKWLIDVNLWGVIHGVHTFLPILRGNADGGWIVNTASMGGLSTFPKLGAYATTKFAVTALTETLALELEEEGIPVGATLLCPGPIHSNLGKSSRNRPDKQTGSGLADVDLEQLPQYKDRLPWRTAAEVGELVVQSIREGRLYAVTHPEQFERVERRAEKLLHAFKRKMHSEPTA